MHTVEKSNRMIGFAITTAMAGVMLAGCTSDVAPQASVSAAQAQQAMASGKHKRAIEHAEAAVAADPRNAEYRSTLGQSYLDAGRFASASTSFQDAIDLGDTSARTTLSYALALTGEGRLEEAQDLLRSNHRSIAAADLGLALTLAGDPQSAVQVMSSAIRGGENTVKMRQNLAYSFAMAGRWREARLMTAQDVPADAVGARMEEWASQARPQDYRMRLAAMLDVPVNTVDNGQPVSLALGNNPSIDQLASHALDTDTAGELVALDGSAPAADSTWAVNDPAPAAPVAVASADSRYNRVPANQPANFADAFGSSPSAPQADAGSYIAASAAPAARAKPAMAPRTAALVAPAQKRIAAAEHPTHLVQLGSFSSPQGAERAKAIYLGRYPDLDGSRMIVTEAVVRGKRFWRVSAAGFDMASSRDMCGRVRSSGKGCIAWADGKPLPGAVETGVRMARR